MTEGGFTKVLPSAGEWDTPLNLHEYKNNKTIKYDINISIISVPAPLNAVAEIATENNSTTLFPIPIDLLKACQDSVGKSSKGSGGGVGGGTA